MPTSLLAILITLRSISRARLDLQVLALRLGSLADSDDAGSPGGFSSRRLFPNPQSIAPNIPTVAKSGMESRRRSFLSPPQYPRAYDLEFGTGTRGLCRDSFTKT
jgi:hypothetical protein